MKKHLWKLILAVILLLAVAFFPVPQKTVVTFPVAVREAQDKDYWEPTAGPCTMGWRCGMWTPWPGTTPCR